MSAAFSRAGYPTPEVIYWNLATKMLRKGESHALAPSLAQRKLTLELASDSASILCGACLAYDDAGNHLKTVCFCDRSGLDGALTHSGDTVIDDKSRHQMTIDVARLPSVVSRLYFSLCSCGPSDLSGFPNPYISLSAGKGRGSLVRYNLADVGKAPSALMACLSRHPGGAWAVTAIGDDNAKVKCCGNYGEMQELCLQATIAAPPQATAEEEALALPVEGELPGVELLCGFSAGMLGSLLEGDLEDCGLGVAMIKEEAITPSQKLLAKLRGERYSPVREAVLNFLLAARGEEEEEEEEEEEVVVVPPPGVIEVDLLEEEEEEGFVCVSAVVAAVVPGA